MGQNSLEIRIHALRSDQIGLNEGFTEEIHQKLTLQSHQYRWFVSSFGFLTMRFLLKSIFKRPGGVLESLASIISYV